MDHTVIPAPARFDAGGGRGFAFRPGTVVAHADTRIAPVVGRFCTQIARRTGLPRLAGVAHKAWSAPQLADWPAHRDRLARHGRLWAQDGLTYFRAATVDWAKVGPGPRSAGRRADSRPPPGLS